ncbi:hypothetical protein ACFVGV_17450 [Pseudarthrobacter scleromae]|uniref:hypothetical protein n=1 Tax=Pseudarthrobacter scleromae TaxID=158897 RepID=UPI00363DF63D
MTYQRASEEQKADGIAAPVGNLFGSLTAAIAGQAIAGHEGALTGAIVGPILEETGRTVMSRLLGARDRRRVESAVTFATAAVKRNLGMGMSIRQDSFWEARGGFPPPAQETLEAVLMAAQRDPEERKLRLLGNAYAYIACDPAMTPSASHWLIKTAEALTWTQLQLLSLVARVDELETSGIAIGKGANNWDSVSLHKELIDLGTGGRFLIHGGYETLQNGIKIPSSALSTQRLVNPGTLIFGALRLGDIATSELEDIVARLRRPVSQAANEA